MLTIKGSANLTSVKLASRHDQYFTKRIKLFLRPRAQNGQRWRYDRSSVYEIDLKLDVYTLRRYQQLPNVGAIGYMDIGNDPFESSLDSKQC